MKLTALQKQIRSLNYRRQLATDIPIIENSIRGELVARNIEAARIGPFIIHIDNTSLIIKNASSVPSGQRKLPFLEEL